MGVDEEKESGFCIFGNGIELKISRLVEERDWF